MTLEISEGKRGFDFYITPELWQDRAALEAWTRTLLQGDLDAIRSQLEEPFVTLHAELDGQGGYHVRAIYRTVLGSDPIPQRTKFFFHEAAKWPMEKS